MTASSIHPDWADFDSLSASVDGWDLFPGFSGDKRKPFLLQARSQLGVFASDEAAWSYVWRKAEAGSALHMRALAFLKKHSPIEHADMRRHGLGLNANHTRFQPKEDAHG